ncbi:MAG: prephenate dehydratase [Alphaproteobacteria bacterium]
MPGNSDPSRTIAFQGMAGAYSDLACRSVYPDMQTLPCPSFEDVFTVVEEGSAALAMIPIENSVAGRVAEIHQLLPHTKLRIVAEHFQRVNHHLLALPDARIEDLEAVHSHVHALSQCRSLIRELGLEPVVHADTGGAAADVAARGDKHVAAIASGLAGDIYGLVTLRSNIEDAEHNTTRFLVLAREPVDPDPEKGSVITSFVFRVRNVPAAVYKALGGFATNGVNMTRLESYMIGGEFQSAQFYADVEGHPGQTNLRLAFEELDFYSREVKILGVYYAHPFRHGAPLKGG